MFLAISCNKDNGEDLVGGEDVTDPRLNPGGVLLDDFGVNIVGAWALCLENGRFYDDGEFDDMTIFFIESNGDNYNYSEGDDSIVKDIFLDDKGILNISYSTLSSFYKGDKNNNEIVNTKVSSMFDLFCPQRETIYIKNLQRTMDVIDNKTRRLNCSYDLDDESAKMIITLSCIDVDTYLMDYSSSWEWTRSSEVFNGIYLRRVKGFLYN